jgi:glycosyltransferase involved in cell wall biosynthesis
VKALHVIPSIAPRYGGPSAAIRSMTSGLASLGVNVSVATTDADGRGRMAVPLDRPITESGVSYHFFPRSLPGEWKYSRPLSRWLHAHAADFDVVHIHALFSYATIPGSRAASRAHVPYVLRPLGTLDPWSLGPRAWKKRPYLELIEKQHLGRAAAIHVTSAHEGRGLAELGYGEKVRVIPLGVAQDGSAPARARVRSAGPFRLLFLGRLHPVKGLPLLIEAVGNARRGGESLEVTIAGDGDRSYTQHLAQLCARFGVEDIVRFVGHVDDDDKRKLFAEADLLVLPSLHENFGIAAAEAMASGVPVVVSDQVGVADDVQDADAGLVVPCDSAALAGAILRLTADEAGRARMGLNAAAAARARFSWSRASEMMLQLYNELVPSERRLCAA